MKNVTIKLEDDVARWSRVWAAEHNTSVSRILGDLLKRMKSEKTGYVQTMQQFLSVEPRPLKDQFGYSWWDTLIISSALVLDCGYLLSEDMRHEQKIAGLTIINPFLIDRIPQ